MQHFLQKETDKREQAAEQTDESPIAYGRNTKARPGRYRQHVLIPTAGTRPERNLIGNKSRNGRNDTYRKQPGEPSGADGKSKDSRARIRDTLS